MDIIADKFWVVYRSLSQNFDLNLAVIFFWGLQIPCSSRKKKNAIQAKACIAFLAVGIVSARFMRRELCEKPV